jgi:hypothetical protein
MTNNFREYYLRQAGGNGIFVGAPRQRGHGLGGMFKSFYRYVVPLFKSHALPMLKEGARTVGSEAIKAATNVGLDALKGHSLKESARNNFGSAIQNLSETVQSKIQTGKGCKKLQIGRGKKIQYKAKSSRKKQRTMSDIFD